MNELCADPASCRFEPPAEQVRPELRPRLVGVAAVALGADEHEGPVQAGVDHRPEQGAVQVDAGLDPRVLVHGLGGGGAAEGVAEHATLDSRSAPRSPDGSGRCSASGLAPAFSAVRVSSTKRVSATRTATAFSRTSGVVGGMAGVSTRPSGNSTVAAVVGVIDRDDDVSAADEFLDQDGAAVPVAAEAG